MTRQNGPRFDENYLRQGNPTNATFAESVPRTQVVSNCTIAATGVEISVAVPLQAGDVVSSITFLTATTAASAPTAGYACLRSTSGALLAQTADFGSTARAANTAYTVALATAQLITAPGMYYVGISFTASTVPTLMGVALHNAVAAGAIGLTTPVVLSQSHGSAVGATAPATTATPTTLAAIPYVVCT
jgi:hypothetical protein